MTSAQAHSTPVTILKPSVPNAMIPKCVKSFIFSSLIALFLYLPVGYTVLVRKLALPLWILIFAVLVLFIVTFAIEPFIFYMNLRTREYRFFADRVEYYEGWLTINQHTIPYQKVTDITLTKTVWDRFFNTATIGILTPASFSGSVYIPYVKQPEKVYEYLQREVIKIK